MKKIIISSCIAISLFAFACKNNNSSANSSTDSTTNQPIPGNSPVTPNSNERVLPNGNEVNSNGLDTGKIDSIAGVDTVNAPH